MRIQGFYINLLASSDRRAQMQTQLAELGLGERVRRFPAVDGRAQGPFDDVGRNTVWACRRSHENVVLQSDAESATIVFEDDVEISRDFATVIHEHSMDAFVRSSPNCDVLFLDCCPFYNKAPFLLSLCEQQMPKRAVPAVEGAERHALTTVSLVDARSTYAYCAAAYIVTPRGKKTLGRLFAETHDDRAIDRLYHDWIADGALNAQIAVPFLASPPYTTRSTIAYEHLERPTLEEREGKLAAAIRRLLFAGDAKLCTGDIDALLRPADVSDEHRLGMQLYETCRSFA
ncbi:hypothetical protein [Caballeronia sp. Lep1P3]|uniref:hypothetical protein n=1 Tax=Caballeronia sp. Lep1P3 TaxID=2878150 RepID=UPI001FD275C1|nr:hypothetical protein [Caballeronia sp. Lep1P3]